jgi:recombination protein RecR
MIIDDLAELLSKFPGIGPRQSRRFVYFLLRQNRNYVEQLARSILELKKETAICTECHQFFPDTVSKKLCRICSNSARDRSTLMVVEKDVDLENVERTGVYNGVYFVLGGTVPLTNEEPEKFIRLNDLLARTKNGTEKDSLSEIILATNATTEGDHTADYLHSKLALFATNENVKITHLGRGLSTGTELEYSDKETLRSALSNRK